MAPWKRTPNRILFFSFMVLGLSACSGPDATPGRPLSPKAATPISNVPGTGNGNPNPVVNASKPDAGNAQVSLGDGGVVWIADYDSGAMATGPDPAQPMPNFSLVDKNPQSPDLGEYFSPRYFLNRVSAWYFSHAT